MCPHTRMYIYRNKEKGQVLGNDLKVLIVIACWLLSHVHVGCEVIYIFSVSIFVQDQSVGRWFCGVQTTLVTDVESALQMSWEPTANVPQNMRVSFVNCQRVCLFFFSFFLFCSSFFQGEEGGKGGGGCRGRGECQTKALTVWVHKQIIDFNTQSTMAVISGWKW